jgi:hypothetical protein
MVGLLGDLIPIGLFLALGPTRIISTILLLTSARPMRNVLAFLGGTASVYLVIGIIAVLFFGRALSDIIVGTPVFDTILFIVGVFLLVYAARSLFKVSDPDVPFSGWIQHLSSISAGRAYLFGVILSCSIQNLLVFLGGVTLIYDTGLPAGQRVTALLVLIALALLGQMMPVLLYAANAKRARAQLSALMTWLYQHNRVITTGFSLVVGIIFLVASLNELVPLLRTVL